MSEPGELISKPARHLPSGPDDSAGLFQQRPSQGWGSYWQVTNREYATNTFYSSLLRVSGWQGMSVAQAAQAAQRSAYPSRVDADQVDEIWLGQNGEEAPRRP